MVTDGRIEKPLRIEFSDHENLKWSTIFTGVKASSLAKGLKLCSPVCQRPDKLSMKWRGQGRE